MGLPVNGVTDMNAKPWVLGLTAIGLAALATPSAADPVRQGYSRGQEVRYDYARVVDVKPLIRTVQVQVPVRECYDREVLQRRQPNIGRTIVGGIVGGVIGSQFGSGSGREAATVVGSVIGAAAANDAKRRGPTVRTERFCDVRYEYETRERVDGFRVTYRYNGETFVTRTATDPGNRIRVRVSVAPARR